MNACSSPRRSASSSSRSLTGGTVTPRILPRLLPHPALGSEGPSGPLQRRTSRSVPGGLVFGAGALLFALGIGVERAYAADFLPATLLTGAGVGLTFAAFGSAAVAELPRTRFATGSAINNTFRQIGAALGIAALIAVLGASTTIDDFRRAWTLIAVTGAVAALTAVALGRVRARHVGELALSEPAPSPTRP